MNEAIKFEKSRRADKKKVKGNYASVPTHEHIDIDELKRVFDLPQGSDMTFEIAEAFIPVGPLLIRGRSHRQVL